MNLRDAKRLAGYNKTKLKRFLGRDHDWYDFDRIGDIDIHQNRVEYTLLRDEGHATALATVSLYLVTIGKRLQVCATMDDMDHPAFGR